MKEKMPHTIDIVGNIENEREYAAALRRENYISPTLLENPSAALDFQTEVKLYFSRINRGENEKAIISLLSEKINFSPDIVTITTIPTYVKETNIANVLKQYLQLSPEDLRRHHIVVFLNAGRNMDKAEYSAELEKRRREIEAVSGREGLHVTVVDYHFPDDVILGRVRGLLADAIISKSYEAGLTDPVLVSNDADSLYISNDYLRQIRSSFSGNPGLDASGCLILYGGYGPNGENHLGGRTIPELFIGDLVSQFSDEVVRRGEGDTSANIYTSGPNMAVRLSALCAMGGYDLNLNFKEEVEIGRRAKAMRMRPGDQQFFHPEHFTFLDKPYIVTSVRRAIRAVLNGGVVVSQWDDFDDVIGADIDTEGLLQRYQENKLLIQEGDLRLVRTSNAQAIKKIISRTEEIIIQSLRVDQVSTPQRLMAIARRLEVEIDSFSFTDGHLTSVKIGPRSKLLNRVINLAK